MTIRLKRRTIRTTLEAERARLVKYVVEEQQALNQVLDASADPADLAQTLTSREHRRALLAQAQHHLAQVEAALNRLADGTYGTCTLCGRHINAERLHILPYASTCIHCQQQQEHSIGLSG